MERLHLHYHGELYTILYDPDTFDIVEVTYYPDGRIAQVVDFDELEDELQDKIERAVTC